ncbi:MAG: hypothetical protein K2Z81_05410 [Cyanobacteria bacterium]|nr:hypothetical protein [Cyanobacteriota bacterium]
MKVLRFSCGQPEWSVPLDELSIDMKRMLRVQWREFIRGLEVGDSDLDQIDPDVIAMLERMYAKK